MLGAVVILVRRTPLATARRIWLVVFALVLGNAVTAMAAHAFVAKWGFRGDNEKDGLVHLMDATAHRPFVYRRLAPELVATATNLAYPHLSEAASAYLINDSPLKRYRANWVGVEEDWSKRKALAFHFAYLLVWSTLFGALLAMAGLLRALRTTSWFESILTASIGICLLPLMFVNGGYLYDAPELFLWTATLLIAIRGPLLLLPPVFLLMLVNKESALIAVPSVAALLDTRLGRAGALKWSGFLGAIGVGWLWHVHARFAGSPGTSMEMYLGSNLTFWSNPMTYLKIGTPYAPFLPSPRGGNVVLLLLAFIPLRFGWRSIRADARLATLAMALLIVPLFLVAGSKDEMRGLSLLFPLLFVVGSEGVHALFLERGVAE